MTTVAAKPIPKPLFSCAGACSEDVSHYAEELWVD